MKLKTGKTSIVVGKVRRSQAITTFGIGSMVDLINHTVMMKGLDSWNWYSDSQFQIYNPGLEKLLKVDYFVKPKISQKNTVWEEDKPDIPATIFPKWLYCPHCKSLQLATKMTNNKFYCYSQQCAGKKNLLLPSRFVLVCPNGHIEDFPYSWWVHESQGKECNCSNPQFRMYYVGNKTDMNSLFIECTSCGAKKSMNNASSWNAFADYKCTGNRPWLGDKVECNASDQKKFMQMRIRDESSVYFPCTVSALSIPPWSSKIAKEFKRHLGTIEVTDSTKNVLIEIVGGKYPNYSKNDLRRVLERILASDERKCDSMQDIIEDEYTAILNKNDDLIIDDFVSHDEDVPNEYSHIIDRVIAIDRLTEITVMVGFSRLTANSGLGDPNLSPISKTKLNWLPGIEQKGEGIFIKFNQDILNEWTKRNANHYNVLRKHLDESLFENDRFSAQYVFMHSFAHLFIRELSNLCGYSSASIKERIYSTYNHSDKQICGILIYTSTSDADGSLGGLVEQAKRCNLSRILMSMIERGKWCSADPVCYTSTGQGVMSLNYAACFACTLLPETSCEFHNALLDRCSVCGQPEDEMLGLMNWRKDY